MAADEHFIMPAQPDPVLLEADDDEGYDDARSTTSSTASLTSSIAQFPFEYGRRYHAYKDGIYIRPNDEAELDRLDLVHSMILMVHHGKLHLAPLSSNLQRALDIGAGSGIWCMEFADENPSAEVIGVDLSPTLPTMVPPNLNFEIWDVEDEWEFSNQFDYIHSRYMAGSIKDWPGLMQRCFKNVRPGGWVEFQDFDIDYYSQDGSLKEEHALRRWLTHLQGAGSQTGRTLRPGPELESWARKAGFKNVQVTRSPLPLGSWPKDPLMKRIGLFNWTQLYEGLQGLSDRLFLNLLGWSKVDLEMLLLEVRKDLKDKSIHAIFDLYTVCAQRPGELAV